MPDFAEHFFIEVAEDGFRFPIALLQWQVLWVLGAAEHFLFEFVHAPGEREIAALRGLRVYGPLDTVGFY